MKATTLITVFLATAVTTVTAQMPRIQSFKLRVTTYRGALPAFSGNIDLFQDFSVGVGRSNDPNYSGFVQVYHCRHP